MMGIEVPNDTEATPPLLNNSSIMIEPNIQNSSIDGASTLGSYCYQCREKFDRTQFIEISSCPCGCRICSQCWEQVYRTFGVECPACSTGAEPLPSTSYNDSYYSASYDPNVLNDVQSSNNLYPLPRINFIHQQRPRRCSDDYDPRGTDIDLHQLTHSFSESQFLDSRHRSNSYSCAVSRNFPMNSISQNSTPNMKSASNRKSLQNLRVIQRNLVYVIGLHSNITVAEAASPQYFGQYGRIVKIVINNHLEATEDKPRHGSRSAYITFQFKEDAWSAIKSVDGFKLGDRFIHASFGTTKYCNSFLRNQNCDNRECLFLHEFGDERDRYTKDQIQAGLSRLGSNFAYREEFGGSPSGTGVYCPCPVLPPPHQVSRASSGRRAESLDLGTSGNLCYTPKKGCGNLDWSPRISNYSPHQEVYSFPETRKPRANTMGSNILEPRVVSSGLPPLNRPPADPSSFDERHHPYQRFNKFGMMLDQLHESGGNAVQSPYRKDPFFRSNVITTRSLSEGNLDFDNGYSTPKKGNAMDGSPSALEAMAAIAISNARPSPSSHTPKTTPNGGGSSMWSSCIEPGTSPRATASFSGYSSGGQTPINKSNGYEVLEPAFAGGGKGIGQFCGIASFANDGGGSMKSKSTGGEDDRLGLPPIYPNKSTSRNFNLNNSSASVQSSEPKGSSAQSNSNFLCPDLLPARSCGVSTNPSSPPVFAQNSIDLLCPRSFGNDIVDDSSSSNQNSNSPQPYYEVSEQLSNFEKMLSLSSSSIGERWQSTEDREITPPPKYHKESLFDDFHRYTTDLGL